MKDPSDGGLTVDQMRRFLCALSPFAPHIAEELWHRIGESTSVGNASWPIVDEKQLIDDMIELPVQIQGKVRARVGVPSGADAAEIERLVLEDAKVRELLEGRAPKKVIVVPKRMVNLLI